MYAGKASAKYLTIKVFGNNISFLIAYILSEMYSSFYLRLFWLKPITIIHSIHRLKPCGNSIRTHLNYYIRISYNCKSGRWGRRSRRMPRLASPPTARWETGIFVFRQLLTVLLSFIYPSKIFFKFKCVGCFIKIIFCRTTFWIFNYYIDGRFIF